MLAVAKPARKRSDSESTTSSTVQSRPLTASLSSPPQRRRRRLRQRPTPSPLTLGGDPLEDTLTDVSFGHNLLGDGFNVEFSTDEFRDLASLRHLDLSYNMLRGVAEGILEGCAELKVGN